MSLAPSRPVDDLDEKLERQGFRPSSLSALEPGEVELCSRLHCQRCRQPEPECRAYTRLTATGQESRAIAVCLRCDAAEVLPRSTVGLLLRRADERAGLAATGAVAAMAVLLGLAGVAHGQGPQIALVMLIVVPVALLTYLARNGPGGADGGTPGPGL